ncbi:hypothetical protein [Mycobacterium sp. E2462]|uniref:hypothetical protein n=1 Tax=Mycobacterium sp. E2462 TaxID=1834133 RepID=UPI0012EA9018|nr:hypothetical protein [Mycobacterium sp. E2462]
MATMLVDVFGVGMVGAALSAGTSRSAARKAAAWAAGAKHRAAATDASVDRGHR